MLAEVAAESARLDPRGRIMRLSGKALGCARPGTVPMVAVHLISATGNVLGAGLVSRGGFGRLALDDGDHAPAEDAPR